MELIKPRNLTEAMELSQMLATATVIPKEYQNNAANVFVALQAGLTLGLGVWQSMQSISIINGKPTIWGDALIALVRNDKRCLEIEETIEEADSDKIAHCRVRRQQEDGVEIIERTFKWSDALRAGLTGRGPWKQYPQRMLQMRARGFALRDAFPDVLNGMITLEEAEDFGEEMVQPSYRQAIETKSAMATGRDPKSIVEKLKSETGGEENETIVDAKTENVS